MIISIIQNKTMMIKYPQVKKYVLLVDLLQ